MRARKAETSAGRVAIHGIRAATTAVLASENTLAVLRGKDPATPVN
ncbi:hypothetical protein [Glutamicibacter sp. AOP5-A2-18]